MPEAGVGQWWPSEPRPVDGHYTLAHTLVFLLEALQQLAAESRWSNMLGMAPKNVCSEEMRAVKMVVSRVRSGLTRLFFDMPERITNYSFLIWLNKYENLYECCSPEVFSLFFSQYFVKFFEVYSNLMVKS